MCQTVFRSEGRDRLWTRLAPTACNTQLLPSPAWAEGTVLSLCVCVCVCLSVCVLPQNCCKLQLSQNLNKLQVTNLVI